MDLYHNGDIMVFILAYFRYSISIQYHLKKNAAKEHLSPIQITSWHMCDEQKHYTRET